MTPLHIPKRHAELKHTVEHIDDRPQRSQGAMVFVLACAFLGMFLAKSCSADASDFEPPPRNRWDLTQQMKPLDLEVAKSIAHMQADFQFYFDNWPLLKSAYDAALIQASAQERRATTCEGTLTLVRLSEATAWTAVTTTKEQARKDRTVSRVYIVAALAAIVAESVLLSVIIASREPEN